MGAKIENYEIDKVVACFHGGFKMVEIVDILNAEWPEKKRTIETVRRILRMKNLRYQMPLGEALDVMRRRRQNELANVARQLAAADYVDPRTEKAKHVRQDNAFRTSMLVQLKQRFP